MNSTASFTTNAAEVYDRFLELNRKEMKKALTAGLKKVLVRVRKEARQNLRKAMPNAGRRGEKYQDTLLQGIRISKVKEERDGTIFGFVLATSTRKTGSGSFRLKFFESGTALRKNRKGYNRGRVGAIGYLQTAKNNADTYFGQTMAEGAEKAIEKMQAR